MNYLKFSKSTSILYTKIHQTSIKTQLKCFYSSRREPFQSDSFLDIGTRQIYEEEHDIFRQMVRKFFKDEVKPNEDKWAKAGQVDRELWLKAGKLGLLGIDTPIELGGSGADFLMASIVMEEQAYANSSGPGFHVHSHIVMPYLARIGSPEQKAKYIPGMTSGKIIGSIAMSEPGAGSDLQGIRTNARKDGSDYVINGQKTFITNGFMCDVVITVAVMDPGAKSVAHGIGLFLVDADNPGLKKGKKLEKMGMKAQDTSELFYEDCRVPSSALLGKENNGFYYLMQELPQERLIISVVGVAHAEFMFEETRKYTVRHKLAEIKSEIAVARTFVDRCLLLHSQKKLDMTTAAIAKYWTTDMQNRVANQCVQLHGGWGYMLEYPICRAFVDARAQSLYGGTNEIMKELISRSIFP
uniref:Long-chain-acyl-CoA dehydrogenase n=1 Tax=Strigamia maritima TaxID=126957 RepID=T1JLT5_STRMM